jgi:hypothetical protein
MQNKDLNIMRLVGDAKKTMVSHANKYQTQPYQSSLY